MSTLSSVSSRWNADSVFILMSFSLLFLKSHFISCHITPLHFTAWFRLFCPLAVPFNDSDVSHFLCQTQYRLFFCQNGDYHEYHPKLNSIFFPFATKVNNFVVKNSHFSINHKNSFSLSFWEQAKHGPFSFYLYPILKPQEPLSTPTSEGRPELLLNSGQGTIWPST